ncbi:hypothetical protein BH10PLA2_BH10PLA2_24760 [soil metagenome]
MIRKRDIILSVLAWMGIGVFWLVATRTAHPTFELDMIVTGSLITAYAAAAYTNHLILIPRFWQTGRIGIYLIVLLASMSVLTGMALAVIRVSYERTVGPDPDPNGVYIHFAIDFFGMVVHLVGAAGVVWMWRRIRR